MGGGVSFRDEFPRLYRRGWTLTEIAQRHGVSRDLVVEFLERAGIDCVEEVCPYPIKIERQKQPTDSGRPKAHPTGALPESRVPKTWCYQCERRVSSFDADRCDSQWCKAKAVAA